MKVLSKQQRWQQRKRAEGCCIMCGEPAVTSGIYCLKHLTYHREWRRKKYRSTRRYNSLTYRLESSR
jgi:hypothetical protein